MAAELADLLGWETVIFFDDVFPRLTSVGDKEIAGNIGALSNELTLFDGIFVAIGDNRARRSLTESFENTGLVSLIHPAATISPSADIDDGVAIMAGAIVNARSKLGRGVIINTGSSIDHDCVIGDYVHVSPGVNISGGVRIGTESWVGIGASIIQDVTVGCHTIVGAGSVVLSDIPDRTVAVGVPCKVIKSENRSLNDHQL